MNERVEVLLVGETAQSSLHLTQWLERRGCRCQFSSSCKEACNLIADQAFDFVLSHFELPDNSAYPILEKLVGSATTLFFSKLIEHGCPSEFVFVGRSYRKLTTEGRLKQTTDYGCSAIFRGLKDSKN
jgi:DNA-binding NtrC family response regulator